MIYIDFIFDIDIIKYSLYFYLYKGIIILYIIKYLLICNVNYNIFLTMIIHILIFMHLYLIYI